MKGIDPIFEAAANWHASMAGDDPDFDGFALWLEASPLHRAAYDRIVLADALVEQNVQELRARMPANDSDAAQMSAQGRKRWMWLGAVAAALALALLLVPMVMQRSPETESAGQEVRTIAMGNSANIKLDAGSVMRLDDRNGRAAEIVRGRAFFTVRHDAARPFSVKVGEVEVRDLGTQFEVHRQADLVTVSVVKGMVAVGGKGLPFVRGQAGEQLIVRNGKVEKRPIDSASVATWRDGRLVYENAPLSRVVADINRYSQKKLALAPELAEQRFSGVLTIGNGNQIARNLADLMGVSLVETTDGQRLVARP